VPGCSSEPDVFSFADDDLCEWVTEAEVAEFVAAEFDWDGTATEVEGVADFWCRWELSSADGTSGSVTVSDGGQLLDFDGNRFDYDATMEAQGVLDYTKGSDTIGEFVAGHPSLSDGAVVFNGGFGQFMFGVPPSTEWIQLWIELGDLLPARTRDDWDSYELRFFAVADHFLQELGWVS
jgi:hypothetical protein